MARRPAQTQPINTGLPKGRKRTQRERIVNGMIAAANRDGYAGANVSAVIEQAGVSRPTFYDYFADRDEILAFVRAELLNCADYFRALKIMTSFAIGCGGTPLR